MFMALAVMSRTLTALRELDDSYTIMSNQKNRSTTHVVLLSCHKLQSKRMILLVSICLM